MTVEELRRRGKSLNKSSDKTLVEMKLLATESERVEMIAKNATSILEDLDSQFERKTKLGKVDFTFLFFTVMLQSLRWVLIPKLNFPTMEELELAVLKDSRMLANEKNHVGGPYGGKSSGALFETCQLKKYREKHSDIAKLSQDAFYNGENKYRSWIEILTQNVPYDAMNAMDASILPNIAGLNKKKQNGQYSNIHAKNHHVATLGHDPMLGWIFGTMNILTETISFVDFTNYDVLRGHRIKSLGVFDLRNELMFSDQRIDYASPRNISEIIVESYKSACEDVKRIPAAVVRQAIHMNSDKYCREGLPIPILSTIDAKKTQELIEKGWNSEEFNRLLKTDASQVGVSALVDICINMIVEAIYLFCVESKEDVLLRKAKIKRIIEVASVISSSSNLIYAAVTDNLSKLDVGGIGVTLVKLLTTDSFISQIKREYLVNNFCRMIDGIE